MDIYTILKSLSALEKKSLTESADNMTEMSDDDFDKLAMARHKAKLRNEKSQLSPNMFKNGDTPRKSEIPAALRKSRGDEPLNRQDLDETNDKEIDYNSLEIDGIDYRDAPEFSDAYFSDGYYTDGTQLSDEDLEKLSSDGDLVYQYVEKMVYEDNTGVGEGNEFSGALAKAKSAGAEKFSVDGKQYPVNEVSTGYSDFFDKKLAYQKIGATVDGQAQDYTVTLKDGTRKRYVTKDNRRQVTTLAPVDRNDEVDDEGNVVKRSRGRPSGPAKAPERTTANAYKHKGNRKVEEVEELDELSKSTISSYAKKASKDIRDKTRGSERTAAAANYPMTPGKPVDPEQQRTGMDASNRLNHKAVKRVQGVGRAVDRLTKEEVEETYNSDVKRAFPASGVKTGAAAPKGTSYMPKDKKKAMGTPAVDRLTKEEVDIDPADRGEYDREGDMALNQLHQIADAVDELHSILSAEENLPEWVQSKITKAVDYLDTARDYLSAKDDQYADSDELIAEKAVSRAQQQAAGAALAAKRGEGKAVGASKEMAKMSTKDLEDFASTKHKGLPAKAVDESKPDFLDLDKDGDKNEPMKQAAKDKKDSSKDEVEETTTSGSVATGGKTTKTDNIYGKGVYENAIAESYNKKLNAILSESISISTSTDDSGQRSITVTATDEHADQLAEMLKMAGMSGGYASMDSSQEPACDECGGLSGLHEAECSHKMNEEYSDAPNELYGDMDMMLNKLSGGLNGPKVQVNPNNPGDNPMAMKQLGKTSAPAVNLKQMAEAVKDETEQRLMNLYKRIQ